MSSTNRYVALRDLKAGDSLIEAGQEYPAHLVGMAESFLVSNGDLAVIPGFSEPSTPASAPEEPFEASGAGDGAGEGNQEPSESNGEGESPENTDNDPDESAEAGQYDPSKQTVEEVVEYAEEHPEELETIISNEKEGRGRKTLLSQLEMLVSDEDNSGE